MVDSRRVDCAGPKESGRERERGRGSVGRGGLCEGTAETLKRGNALRVHERGSAEGNGESGAGRGPKREHSLLSRSPCGRRCRPLLQSHCKRHTPRAFPAPAGGRCVCGHHVRPTADAPGRAATRRISGCGCRIARGVFQSGRSSCCAPCRRSGGRGAVSVRGAPHCSEARGRWAPAPPLRAGGGVWLAALTPHARPCLMVVSHDEVKLWTDIRKWLVAADSKRNGGVGGCTRVSRRGRRLRERADYKRATCRGQRQTR